ncbi:Tetratricopeptide TPR_2 repeat protein [Candidatus Sulfopaludibacter sp. SbA3]|nr:Tetratricopeptide TPR_2 repeat protein [Candidatus Sulfopaludibacter sp. SbA3]
MGKIDKRRTPGGTSQPCAAQGSAAAVRRTAWPRHSWRLLALWGLVFVAYSNSLQAGLPFDNASVIGEDPRIRAATVQNIESILRGGYWYGNSPRAATSGLYRPVTTLSYLLNYAVLGNGTHTAGYHAVNLFLHEVNVALVYALGLLIFGEAAPALALAAIWGLHPLLTESVTNIVGRADLLAGFGVFAGLLCHVKAAPAVGRRRVAWLAGLAAAQAIGVFSKENAAVLPGIMLLYDLLWRGRATWRRRVAGYAVLALPFAAYFYLRSGSHPHMAIDFTDNPLASAGFWTARITAVKVMGKYLWLFLWPASLTADYSFNAVPLFGWRLWNWEDAQALLGLAVCVAAMVLAVLLAVRWQRTGTPLLFFLVFFFVALAPTSNLILFIGSIMAERFLYLPSVGLAGCAVAALYALVRRRSLHRSAAARAAWAALGLVCLAFTARTYARNFDWHDDRSLWSSAVAVCPEAARPHYNLGLELEGIPERQFEAIVEYQAAVRIQPDFAEAHNNLANVLARIPGRLPEAIAEYQTALQLRPGLAAAHLNLGNALAHMPGRAPEAIGEFQAALGIRPEFVEARDALANALALIPDRVPEAIAEYQAVLRAQPNRAAVHYGLANVLARIPDRQSEAIAEYRAALRIQPDFMEAHFNLGNTLAKTPARLPEALAEYDAALRLKPDPQLQQMVDRLRAWQKQATLPR